MKVNDIGSQHTDYIYSNTYNRLVVDFITFVNCFDSNNQIITVLFQVLSPLPVEKNLKCLLIFVAQSGLSVF